MFIKIKGVILNTDKIEVVRKIINLDNESFPYAVKCNEKIIFRAETKEERDKFFNNLWQEIEGKENDYSSKKYCNKY